MTDTTPSAPLAGLRVIEVSSFVAAPLGGMTLAQLGADVIRVDPPGGAPDRNRWPLTAGGTSLYWAGLNKGKRSIVVDMRAERGRDVIRGLVSAAPTGTAVVLTNAVGRPWLGYDALREVCPDLIHVQVAGKADGGPAVDYTVNAEVGFPSVTGPAGHADPVNHVLPAWDIACGLYAALGVSAAARHRDRTGEGSQLQVALADVAYAMAGNLGFLAEAQLNHVRRERIGNYLYGGFARDFVCADGSRFMIVALTVRHWRDLVAVTGIAPAVAALETAMGVDFDSEDDRFLHRELLAALVHGWFAARDAADVREQLADTSLLWAPYRTFPEVVEHLSGPGADSPIMAEIDQPGVGRHLAPGLPLTSGREAAAVHPAPQLGEHTVQLLSEELGLGSAAVKDLCDSGICRTS